MSELRKFLVLLLGILSFVGTPAAKALDTDPFDFFGSSWELSVPPASEMKDQGKFPYCGLYAMSSFLELWARGGRPSYAYPSVDEAFLAMGYNRVVGAGNRGTHPLWLAATTQIFGAIPKGSRFSGSGSWPLRDWTDAHDSLMDMRTIDPLLKGTYSHAISSRQFTGRQYLTATARMDFSKMVGIHSNLNEATQPSSSTPPPARLRAGSYKRSVTKMNRLSARMGIRSQFVMVKPGQLYHAVKRQLYARRPVMLSINAGLTQKRFGSYRMITGQDLVAMGTGKNHSHAVTAVGHCDKENTRDPICRRFGRYLARTGVKECIAIQNSWGSEVHDKGYVCIAPRAFVRVGKAALVATSLLNRR